MCSRHARLLLFVNAPVETGVVHIDVQSNEVYATAAPLRRKFNARHQYQPACRRQVMVEISRYGVVIGYRKAFRAIVLRTRKQVGRRQVAIRTITVAMQIVGQIKMKFSA